MRKVFSSVYGIGEEVRFDMGNLKDLIGKVYSVTFYEDTINYGIEGAIGEHYLIPEQHITN